MKSRLPIFEYRLNIRKRLEGEIGGKQVKVPNNVKWWKIDTTSALPPLKNPRIIKRIRGLTGEPIENLIVNIEKGKEVGVSNAVY